MTCSPNSKTDRNPDESKNNIVVHEYFKSYFDSCRVDGSIAIYAYKKQEWIVSDTVGIKVETLPASTFKIINLLIALETKTIVDANEVVNWPDYIDTIKQSTLKTTNDTYLFSTRLLQDREVNRPDFGSCRKKITKKIFRDLGIIK